MIAHPASFSPSSSGVPEGLAPAPTESADDEISASNLPETAHVVGVAQVEAGSHPPVPVSNPAPATIPPSVTLTPPSVADTRPALIPSPASGDHSEPKLNPECQKPATCKFAFKSYSCSACIQITELAKKKARAA